jgi:hypothetical protein
MSTSRCDLRQVVCVGIGFGALEHFESLLPLTLHVQGNSSREAAQGGAGFRHPWRFSVNLDFGYSAFSGLSLLEHRCTSKSRPVKFALGRGTKQFIGPLRHSLHSQSHAFCQSLPAFDAQVI